LVVFILFSCNVNFLDRLISYLIRREPALFAIAEPLALELPRLLREKNMSLVVAYSAQLPKEMMNEIRSRLVEFALRGVEVVELNFWDTP
jgi:hypothetical protein